MNDQKQITIEIEPDVANGVYSNLVLINHGSSEFVIDFVSVMPGVDKAKVQSRVILAPEHAKRLLTALQDNIAKYDEKFVKNDLIEKIQIISKGEA